MNPVESQILSKNCKIKIKFSLALHFKYSSNEIIFSVVNSLKQSSKKSLTAKYSNNIWKRKCVHLHREVQV